MEISAENQNFLQRECVEHYTHLELLLETAATKNAEEDMRAYAEVAAEIFRRLHSLKSNLSALKRPLLSQVIHQLETLLALIIDKEQAFDDQGHLIVKKTLSFCAESFIDRLDLLESQHQIWMATWKQLAAGLRDLRTLLQQKETSGKPVVVNLKLTEKELDSAFQLLEIRFDSEDSKHNLYAFMLLKSLEQEQFLQRSIPTLAQMIQGQSLVAACLFLVWKKKESMSFFRQLFEKVQGVQDLRIIEQYIPQIRSSKTATVKKHYLQIDSVILDQLLEKIQILRLEQHQLKQVAESMSHNPLLLHINNIDTHIMELRRQIIDSKMQPLDRVFGHLESMVTSLARNLRKKVSFEIIGGNVEWDRSIMDQFNQSLMHLLRNAIDHGHEGEKRKKNGKKEALSIVLKAFREGENIILLLEDDGAGLDLQAIVKKSVRKGFVTESAAKLLSKQEKIRLICQPGFSMKEQANMTSGRGIGLDAVSRRVEDLGGELVIFSEQGKGCTFRMSFPLTKALLRVLLFLPSRCHSEQIYGISFHRIKKVSSTLGCETFMQDSQLYLHDETGQYPIFNCFELLGYGSEERGLNSDVERYILRIEDPLYKAAFVVEKMLGQQEVMINALDVPLSRLKFLNGACILENGECAYLVDLLDLLDDQQRRLCLKQEQTREMKNNVAVLSKEMNVPKTSFEWLKPCLHGFYRICEYLEIQDVTVNDLHIEQCAGVAESLLRDAEEIYFELSGGLSGRVTFYVLAATLKQVREYTKKKLTVGEDLESEAFKNIEKSVLFELANIGVSALLNDYCKTKNTWCLPSPPLQKKVQEIEKEQRDNGIIHFKLSLKKNVLKNYTEQDWLCVLLEI